MLKTIRHRLKYSASLAIISIILSACATTETQSTTDTKPTMDTRPTIPAGFTACEEPRPQICTMHFEPACGIDSNGNKKDFGNPCGGCGSPEIIAVINKSCDALSANDREQALADNNPWHKAKLAGVSYRATGNEPSWYLNIKNGQNITLVTDYGHKTLTSDYSHPGINNNQRTTQYTADNEQFIVTITGESCTDSMSGEQFESRVDIQLKNGETLRGCGKALH